MEIQRTDYPRPAHEAIILTKRSRRSEGLFLINWGMYKGTWEVDGLKSELITHGTHDMVEPKSREHFSITEAISSIAYHVGGIWRFTTGKYVTTDGSRYYDKYIDIDVSKAPERVTLALVQYLLGLQLQLSIEMKEYMIGGKNELPNSTISADINNIN